VAFKSRAHKNDTRGDKRTPVQENRQRSEMRWGNSEGEYNIIYIVMIHKACTTLQQHRGDRGHFATYIYIGLSAGAYYNTYYILYGTADGTERDRWK